ncbi:ATPase P-type K/Mg/Cd/Cu/Zn/Na/Ca/Na/H-transporter [Penicillium longicatenatum]|uniref:ATPase P-type K/Mg/Cd/Cu/Zn/Na/Ca/Na/H-transporter n=1 Tax=Penicillium longicatenatum TaxID=1561947 RepID=UPI002546F50C|nr:ATPase P-type K/Mg/Cd/Cu/Zn/Na/Ca/Na/H-transporter [Penicillium longicatenatum]KAJ5649719.1 ATPase P-type K/Mg/Cd/Cu/Zn/Na/Ca/Na/H-transporter [Penicillium longicatenatum]
MASQGDGERADGRRGSRISRASLKEDYAQLDEYGKLVKYVSTFQNADANLEDQGDYEEKRLWYAPWKKRKVRVKSVEESAGMYPDDWLITDIREGLSSEDVNVRRRRSGWNELVSEKENPIAKVLSYFRGPILYVMELAVLLAAGLDDWVDFGVIIGILALNAAVGWYQEKQAADVVASLKGDIAMRAIVIRDSTQQEILARELVPGDVIIVGEGQVVPADAKVICDFNDPHGWEEFNQLQEQGMLGGGSESEDDEPKEGEAEGKEVGEGNSEGAAGESHKQKTRRRGYPILASDHSAITGESLAVDRYMGDMIFYTTGCKRGKAYAVVQTVAKTSFVGRTATMVASAKGAGHFEIVMDNIGTSLLFLVMTWILAAWIGGFFRHIPIASPGQQTLLHYTLSLLIIGVPVGLPVVTTTTMAVGAAYLAKKKAIVQKLTAIESLAGVDILCSDKTGTLTANKLSIRDPYVAEGVDIDWMFAVAVLASSHNIESLDPIDKVTILSLRQYPKAREILRRGWTTEKFTPFDPVSKRIVTVATCDGIRYTCTKGAPKAVLALTNCSQEVLDHYKEKAQEFAHRGFRSLGVAVQKEGEEWMLLGMLPMFDPPREDTAQTISEAQNLGISVKMLTGDAIAIAKETCKMLALGTKVYNSDRLIHGGLSGAMASDLVEKADGFAEVFPEHKYQVVQMLQERGHLTAMTGDGVNDAPSLKKADCGIAVEGASEAAQSASDIVFLEPGLSTIIDSIKVARQIFHRMKAYIQYRIALCLHLEIYLVTSMIILNESIRVELIVFLALFADLATVAVAYDHASFELRPVEWQLPKIWFISSILGLLLALGTWVVRGSMFLKSGGIIQNWGSVQEVLFLQVALTENWLIFVTRGIDTWPSLQLVTAILGVDILATIFCLFGWFTNEDMKTDPADSFVETKNGWTDIVTVVRIWCFSLGVEIVIALVYFILNKIKWLDNLGRQKRSKGEIKMENLLGHLARLNIEYEEPGKPPGRYHLATSKEEEGME